MSAWVFLIHFFFYAGFYCSKTVLITYLFWDQQQWQWLCWDALEYLQLVISFNDPRFPYNRANTDCSLHIHKKWNDFINWFAFQGNFPLKMMKTNFNVTFINYVNKIFPICHYTVLQWRIRGRGLGAHPPLFLDQTEARHGNYKPFYRVQG